MTVVRTVLFRVLGVALLLALATGVVWYTVVVPRQRAARFHAAPDPTPTATDATATSVPASSPIPSGSTAGSTHSDGVVHDFLVKVGACYETHAATAGDDDVTPTSRACDTPHNTVGVGAYRLPEPAGAAYDEQAVSDEATRLCLPAQVALIAGRDGYRPLLTYPGADLWADGGRDVGCLVRDDSGDVTGSFAG